MSGTRWLCFGGAVAGLIACAWAAGAQVPDPFAGSYADRSGQASGEIRRAGLPGRYRVDLETFNPETTCGGSIHATGVARGGVLFMTADEGDGTVCRMRLTRVGTRLRFSDANHCANRFSGPSCGFISDYRRVQPRPVRLRRR